MRIWLQMQETRRSVGLLPRFEQFIQITLYAHSRAVIVVKDKFLPKHASQAKRADVGVADKIDFLMVSFNKFFLTLVT